MRMSLHLSPCWTWRIRASEPRLSLCKMREVLTVTSDTLLPRMSMSGSEKVANLFCLFVSISPVFRAESPHVSHVEEIMGSFLQG